MHLQDLQFRDGGGREWGQWVFGFLGFFIFTMCSQYHMIFTLRGGIGFFVVHNLFSLC
jgi:hypothetical protein